MAQSHRSELEQQVGNLNGVSLRLIGDYDIHQTSAEQPEAPTGVQLMTLANNAQREAQPSDFDPTLAPHPVVPYPVSNPGWWEQAHRRVPDYRPVNRELDREQRRQNPLFTAVGTFMIAGCSMIAVSGLLHYLIDITIPMLLFFNRTGRHYGGTLLAE
ncbi:hypothetical protein BDV41DRAFT_569399 [Aspergillus transmontanensis]|uniref:Uncharacterized protein n=1 Tax=Aspergillus transmontanensis TaxID=1034304 RepID=A0A5N6VEX1_9EURO|nr:hypothetical protein BDV41DRAFT_569399 [Aspergillus transmontanensis]